MSDNVVQFGDLYFKARGRRVAWEQDRCAHKHLTLDSNGDMVMCDDCGKQVSAFWALQTIVDQWGQHARAIERRQERLNDEVKSVVHLIAAKKVERAWRSRKMVPICPHCSEPIFPEDGFGESNVNREIARRRRDAKRPSHS